MNLLDCKCKNCKLIFKTQKKEGLICPRCYKNNLEILKEN